MKLDRLSPAADRNLLFGILAVQMDFVSADQLIAAINAWVRDRVAAVSVKTAQMSQAPWMQSGMKTVAALSRTLRWTHLRRIRDGALNHLADQGRYELAGDQARRLPELTREAGDYYVTAQTLAYTAGVAKQDESFTTANRDDVIEALAADAVKYLAAAWEGGHLRRRSGGFAALISSRPALKDLETGEAFAILRDRKDFKALTHRIKNETPPKAAAKPNTVPSVPRAGRSAEASGPPASQGVK